MSDNIDGKKPEDIVSDFTRVAQSFNKDISRQARTQAEYAIMPVGRAIAFIVKSAGSITRSNLQKELTLVGYKGSPMDGRFSGSIGWAGAGLKDYWKLISYEPPNLDSIKFPETVITWTATSEYLKAYNLVLEREGIEQI